MHMHTYTLLYILFKTHDYKMQYYTKPNLSTHAHIHHIHTYTPDTHTHCTHTHTHTKQVLYIHGYI